MDVGHAESIVVRATSEAWFSCGVIAVGCSGATILVTWLVLFLKGAREANHWLGISLGLSVVGFLGSWLGSFQLRLSGNTLEYWSLFGGHQLLNSDEISTARIATGVSEYRDRFRPPIRLEILTQSFVETKPIFINLKVFQREDLSRIFAWLGAKLRDTGEMET